MRAFFVTAARDGSGPRRMGAAEPPGVNGASARQRRFFCAKVLPSPCKPSELLTKEIARRRTFAIISHPDAGKTTLTEKLLLYGGAVQLAGSVTARRKQRATTSDWMELEKQRGISVSSTVLQFDYSGYRVNLLDTPGHQDFSEDTYRVLTAVDAVIMVIDAGKGIETQTRKLFEVCRQRGVPIFTFFNKLDRPAREPLALLDELESVLGLATCPMNYPLGLGPDFRGVYDRFGKQVHLFERTVGGAYRAPLEISDLDSPVVRERLDDDTFHKTREEIEMLDIAGAPFDPAAVLAGELSPVFFGSAANNFGVQLLLDGFLRYSAPPAAHCGGKRGRHRAGEPGFLGLRLQNPGEHGPAPPGPHRVSAHLLRALRARHDRAPRAHGQNRAAVLRAEALCPGPRNGGRGVSRRHRRVGGPLGVRHRRHADRITRRSLTTRSPASRRNVSPTCAIRTRASSSSSARGSTSFCRKGSSRCSTCGIALSKVPLLAAVGPLQFEVVQYRLQSEYGAESRIETASWDRARWLEPDFDPAKVGALALPTGVAVADDSDGWPVCFFPTNGRCATSTSATRTRNFSRCPCSAGQRSRLNAEVFWTVFRPAHRGSRALRGARVATETSCHPCLNPSGSPAPCPVFPV